MSQHAPDPKPAKATGKKPQKVQVADRARALRENLKRRKATPPAPSKPESRG